MSTPLLLMRVREDNFVGDLPSREMTFVEDDRCGLLHSMRKRGVSSDAVEDCISACRVEVEPTLNSLSGAWALN